MEKKTKIIKMTLWVATTIITVAAVGPLLALKKGLMFAPVLIFPYLICLWSEGIFAKFSVGLRNAASRKDRIKGRVLIILTSIMMLGYLLCAACFFTGFAMLTHGIENDFTFLFLVISMKMYAVFSTLAIPYCIVLSILKGNFSVSKSGAKCERAAVISDVEIEG